jgi:hypothetical protein
MALGESAARHSSPCNDLWYLCISLARLLSEQIPVNLLIPVLKKDRLPTITALRNVMGKAGNHRAEGDRRKVPQ